MPDFESAIRESGAGYVTSVGIDFVGIWRGKRLPSPSTPSLPSAATACRSPTSSGRTRSPRT